jgi:hypothetical protein
MGDCGVYIKSGLKRVSATTSLRYEPFGAPILCEGIDGGRGVVGIRNPDAGFSGQLAYQTGLVRATNMGIWNAIGSLSSSPDQVVDFTISSGTTGTAANLILQLGFGFKVSSGNGQADMMADLVLPQCGRVVGTRSFTAETEPSPIIRYEPLCDFQPLKLADRIKVVLVITDITGTGTFNAEIVWRTADYYPELPGAWSSSWTTAPTGSPYQANGEYNGGDAQPNIPAGTNPMWIQPGVKLYTSAGGGFITAQMSSVVATRRV